MAFVSYARKLYRHGISLLPILHWDMIHQLLLNLTQSTRHIKNSFFHISHWGRGGLSINQSWYLCRHLRLEKLLGQTKEATVRNGWLSHPQGGMSMGGIGRGRWSISLIAFGQLHHVIESNQTNVVVWLSRPSHHVGWLKVTPKSPSISDHGLLA